MNDGKYVVAYLLSCMGDPFSRDLELGAIQRAEEENVNLVFLPGKFIHRELDEEIRYEYQDNTVFDLVIEDNVDAVIIAADCIGAFADREQIREFVARYSEVPTVLVGSKQDGKSCICYDNFKGIEDGLNFLIDEKGCTRFAMMGGPDHNTDAMERKDAMKRVLESRRIEFTDKNYVSGTLDRNNHEGVRRLLDRNPGVEAIFCVNDEVAVCAYEVIIERGMIPGEDIYVLGYDNSRLAGQMRPTLSSIWADPVELSRQAFDMAMNLIRGRKTPSRSLDTMLVKRDSFGEDAERIELSNMDTNHVKALYNKVFYRLQGARGVEYKAYQKVIRDCMALITAPEYAPELHEQLKFHFRDAILTGILKYADMELLQMLMQEIYELISDGEGRRKDRKEVRSAYGEIYNMIVAEQQEFIREATESTDDLEFSIKMIARDMVLFEKASDQNFSVPLRKLDSLGIKNAYLYVFDKPIVHLEGEEMQMPEHFYLKSVLKDGVLKYIPAPRQKISIYDFFSNWYIGDERHTSIVLPLYSTEEIYGYLLCDANDLVFDNGEIMSDLLSSAYKMLYLLRSQQEIQDQLERSNEMLKRNNIMLDNLSKSDPMTGIYNRRGFYEAAEACLEGAYATGISVMVTYVDMDNLKIVNDRYGHDDGDFSLKLVASTLQDMVNKDNGVTGRIGGDEFACIIWSDEEPGDFKARIRGCFDDFNARSDKPYNVTVSVGVHKVVNEDRKTLDEALALADDDLYEEKKKRNKNVVKS
mgnify:CR=1 FL=1